jgi:hypothetical protein
MNVNIQYQDATGSWYTVMVTENESARILMGMKTVSSQHPGSRVRAVDENGRVVDIL